LWSEQLEFMMALVVYSGAATLSDVDAAGHRVVHRGSGFLETSPGVRTSTAAERRKAQAVSPVPDFDTRRDAS